MKMRDVFNAKWPKDLRILDTISPRLAIIRGSTQANKPGDHQFTFRFGIGAVDGRGFALDDSGIVLSADELTLLAERLNALIASGEIKAGCGKAEHDEGVDARETFLRQFDAKHPTRFH